MINTFRTSKYLYKHLETIKGVSFYPVVAETNAKYPYCVYRRDSVITNFSKDGRHNDKIILTMDIYSGEDYKTCCELATQLRDHMEHFNITDKDFVVYGCKMVESTENYESDSYVISLTFELLIY